MQIRTIGKPSIDHVLSHIVERYEAQFPGVLATCGICRPEWACENPSSSPLLLAGCREEEYNLKH
jgi:hypothetical protein